MPSIDLDLSFIDNCLDRVTRKFEKPIPNPQKDSEDTQKNYLAQLAAKDNNTLRADDIYVTTDRNKNAVLFVVTSSKPVSVKSLMFEYSLYVFIQYVKNKFLLFKKIIEGLLTEDLQLFLVKNRDLSENYRDLLYYAHLTRYRIAASNQLEGSEEQILNDFNKKYGTLTTQTFLEHLNCKAIEDWMELLQKYAEFNKDFEQLKTGVTSFLTKVESHVSGSLNTLLSPSNLPSSKKSPSIRRIPPSARLTLKRPKVDIETIHQDVIARGKARSKAALKNLRNKIYDQDGYFPHKLLDPDPNIPLNLTRLYIYAWDHLIKDAENLSEEEKAHGTSYEACGYRKGELILQFIYYALKTWDNYADENEKLAELKNLSLDYFNETVLGTRKNQTVGILDHRRSWCCCLFPWKRSNSQQHLKNWLDQENFTPGALSRQR